MYIIAVTTLLHLIWEYAHLPLYRAYGAIGSTAPLVITVAVFGDVLYTLSIIAGIMVIRWIKTPHDMISAWTPKEYCLSALCGFLVALFVEYKALYLHRWAYGDMMPMIPILNVGLTPILQMMILTPLILFASQWLRVFFENNGSNKSGSISA